MRVAPRSQSDDHIRIDLILSLPYFALKILLCPSTSTDFLSSTVVWNSQFRHLAGAAR
jgi:hypothetical protein